MHTSAGTLWKILNDIDPKKNRGKFAIILKKYFRLEGDGGEFEAVTRLMSLSRDVITDIDSSDFDDQAKKALRQNFQPFEPLTTYEIYSQSYDQLKNNVLRENYLNMLYSVDMALDGKLNRFSNQEDQSFISSEFQKVREDVINSTFPDELKSAIVDRLNDVIIAVDHFRVWGPRGLKECLIRLVGEVVMEVGPEEKEREESTLRSLAEKIKIAAGYINKAAETTKSVSSIVKSGVEVAGSIENLMDRF